MMNRQNAQHYNWGTHCDGWVLLPRSDLMIIEERMPPGAAEIRHFHRVARQFFYVLSGTLHMELEGETQAVPAGGSMEIPPLQRHQARNDSREDVRFLVVSSPTTRGDRVDCE
ncbi:cupin [Methylocystis bryophila]|uniref:Cupin n=1 Tax=Methylocystis bryophila TaxID=655015 RepID=A0A1W6N1Q3_9HYPH|nr:cupin [Methylocystis bryophila]